ncbi:unnamed protein product, partial [Rotaria magnacalcarata]
INVPPPNQHQDELHQRMESEPRMMTYQTNNSKISFPLIIIKFNVEQNFSVKEITDDLILKWEHHHEIDLVVRARFGHLHFLLGFADDSSTFESLLDLSRWLQTLNEVEIQVKVPRQLPSEYSLVIQ